MTFSICVVFVCLFVLNIGSDIITLYPPIVIFLSSHKIMFYASMSSEINVYKCNVGLSQTIVIKWKYRCCALDITKWHSLGACNVGLSHNRQQIMQIVYMYAYDAHSTIKRELNLAIEMPELLPFYSKCRPNMVLDVSFRIFLVCSTCMTRFESVACFRLPFRWYQRKRHTHAWTHF